MTFDDLFSEVVGLLFPDGEAENLVTAHKRFLNEALWDASKYVPCLQVCNTNVFPQCATYFNCGMTVLPAPRGRILKVYVIGKDSEGDPDWCSKVYLQQVEYSHIERYVQLSRHCIKPNSLFASALVWNLFGCGWREKHKYPCPTDEGLESLPSLPQGFHYPQSSTDAGGRSRNGVFAIYRGRIYIAPWIESDETIVIEWSGIKNQWADTDLVDDDLKFRQAIRYHVGFQHYLNFEENQQKLVTMRTGWDEALREMISECRKQNEKNNEDDAGTGSEAARGIGSADVASALFYNDVQSYTASCPTGQTGTPVTSAVAQGTIGSSLSVADANARALSQAQSDANSRLSCSVAPTTFLNVAQSFTATCPGASGSTPAATGNSVTVVTPAGQFSSTVSQADADAAALAAAQASANSQLVCTFSNAPQSFTATCPTGTTGTPVTITIAPATFTSTISQSDADTQAQAAAQNQATSGLTCSGGVTSIGNTPQSVPFQGFLSCNNGNPKRQAYSFTIAIPANTYTAPCTNATEAAVQLQLNRQAIAVATERGQIQVNALQAAFQSSCFVPTSGGSGGSSGGSGGLG